MSKKVIRWALFASEFDFKTVFRPGITNQNADTLSRIPKTEENVVLSGQTQVIKALTTQTFAIEQKNDEFCKKVRTKYEKYITGNQENENDSDDCDTDEGDIIKEFENGLLGTADGKIFVPEALKKEILLRFHDSPFAGHLGVKKTLARIQRRFKWPKMAKEIKEYVSKCELCAKRKAVGSSKAHLNPIPPPTHVWQIMAMDLMGPLTPSGPDNHVYILVMGEYLTRYVTVASLPDQTAESVAKAFIKNIITRHGVPEKVLTDQGTNFMSDLMASLYKQCGVTAIRTSAYRPQCDGMVERVNRTLADIIASYVTKEPSKWSEFLDVAAFAYNTAVHSSTGYSPFYLMYGREAREPDDLLPPARNRNLTDVNMIFSQQWYDAIEIAKARLEEAKEKQKEYYDRNARRTVYEVNDRIMLKTLADIPGKFNMRWEGPFTVVEKKGNVNYKIVSVDGKKLLVVHTDRMKKFQGHASPEATAPTVKPKTRKRARFSEKNQLSLVDII